jgi:hypothetical protein
MKEHDGEHDPLAEQLRQFTPALGAIDRDGLIFAAGYASAKKHVGWKALTGALAASQLLTLVLLWPVRPAIAPTAGVQEIATSESRDSGNSESVADVEPHRFQLARLRQEISAAVDETAAPRVSGPIAPDKPAIRAGSSFYPGTLN